ASFRVVSAASSFFPGIPSWVVPRTAWICCQRALLMGLVVVFHALVVKVHLDDLQTAYRGGVVDVVLASESVYHRRQLVHQVLRLLLFTHYFFCLANDGSILTPPPMVAPSSEM